MKWILPQSILTIVLATISLPTLAAATTKIIYGIPSARHFQGPDKGDYLIQLGRFKNKVNADKIVSQIQLKTATPVHIDATNGSYAVQLGPVASAAEVRAIGDALSSKSKINAASPAPSAVIHLHKPLTHAAYSHVIYKGCTTHCKHWLRGHGNWYIEGDVGFEAPIVDNRMTVNNGSGFPAPSNQDSLSTKTRWGAIIGGGAGYRWQRNTQWLPAYALGLRYKHLFASNIGQQVTQYSLPEFTNYNYGWNVAADVVMVAGKVDLIKYGQVLPFINGGIGVAINRTSSYTEAALTGVDQRINPGFTNNNTVGLAYSIGAGLDWQIHPQLIVSLDYEFQSLGNISSGNGSGSWAGDHLHSGKYQSNNILLSMNYLFGK